MRLSRFKNGLKALALGLALVFSLPSEKAEAIPDVALALVIDGSGSISSANFTLQRDAYAAAITNLIPVNGSVAIGVIQFGNSTVQTVYSLTTINSQGDKDNLIAAINGMSQLNGNTPTGPAIEAATTALLALEAGRQIIDVSTDGEDNSGIDATDAALAAITAGIEQVNCLGIGQDAVCDFETGIGSFEILASSFETFQTAIEQKIRIETNQIPEPATLALLGAGLLGLGLVRRRR